MIKQLLLCSLVVINSFAPTFGIQFGPRTPINEFNREDTHLQKPPQQEPIEKAYISLGSRCSAAINLKRCNLSKAYFPFDFISTPFQSLCTLLETGFKDFLVQDAMKYDTDSARIINSLTGWGFRHDFEENLSNFKAVADKYQRRIERFFHTVATAHKVYFFRTHTTREEAITLSSLLAKLFPSTDFTLITTTAPVSFNAKRDFELFWHLPRVRTFALSSIGNPYEDHHGRDTDWDRIFMQLGLMDAPPINS